jgi:RNA polymerase sigma-70 factor (ECF subfamily)
MAEKNIIKTEPEMELFNEIYLKHSKTVYMYVLVSLNYDNDLADDVIQDVFSLALQKLEVVLSHPNPGGFLIVTAKNYIQKYRASLKKSSKLTSPLDGSSSELSYCEDFDSIFEKKADIDELKREVLAKLSAKEITVYDMFYERKYSVYETAKRLGITENNVKVRLFRLRAKVRNMVKDIFSI